MSGYAGELFSSYSAVEARREWEIGLIKEKLEKNEAADLALCRVERVSAGASTVRFGLKRGKLLYLFRHPHHNVEREKHRNQITRARVIKDALEHAGYTLIPWDFKRGKPPTFWQEPAMEEEDDDLYGPAETPAPADPKAGETKDDSDGENGDEPMDEGLESGEEEEEESDSDLEIIIDKPQTAPKAIVLQPPQESKAIKIEAPPQPSSTPSQVTKSAAPAAPQQPGTAYPAVRTSTIDVNADPVYPGVGKTITQLDIDADLAESSKPWRLPGADQSDYFNYGFDEFTWEMYRQRQFSMSSTLASQKAETAQFQQMFMPGMSGAPPASSGGNTGGVTGAPTGPAAQSGAGMPPAMPMPPGVMNEEQMQMMFQQMASQGADPSQMDFASFMQMASGQMGGGFGGPQQQGGGGAGYSGGPQQGNQAGGGGGGGRGSGRRGRGW